MAIPNQLPCSCFGSNVMRFRENLCGEALPLWSLPPPDRFFFLLPFALQFTTEYTFQPLG